MAWRTIERRAEKDPLGKVWRTGDAGARRPSLKEPLCLDYIRHFVVFEDDGGA